MSLACLVIALLIIALTLTGVITAILGRGYPGYGGYPDEWENKTCEKVYAVIALATLILLAIFMDLVIILVLTS